jgi:hypothetical protein
MVAMKRRQHHRHGGSDLCPAENSRVQVIPLVRELLLGEKCTNNRSGQGLNKKGRVWQSTLPSDFSVLCGYRINFLFPE